MEIKIVKLFDDVELPSYAKDGDSGMDLRAYLMEDGQRILRFAPFDTIIVPTGLKMAIPYGYEGQIRSRSGMSIKGLVVANSPGTVDSGYRGEICVILHNNNNKFQFIEHGDRIAQIVFSKVENATLINVLALSTTDRGEGGFGSTGDK